jgi:tight adherence protein B
MSRAVAVLAGVTMFLLLQAVAAMVAVSRARARASMRARLGIPPREEPLLRGAVSRLDELLAASGLAWSPAGLTVRLVVASIATGAAGIFVGGAGGVVCGLFGPVAIWMWLARAQSRRLAAIDEQLPRALELIALALRAGHPFARALALCTEEADEPLGPELRRVVEEHALGRRLEAALSGLRTRLASSATIRTLVVSVVVLSQTGGNLVDVVDRMRETLAAQAHYRQRLRAVTAESRLSSRMVMALPIVFGGVAALANRSFGSLFAQPAGQALLVLAGLLWLAGVVWVQRLVRPEV